MLSTSPGWLVEGSFRFSAVSAVATGSAAGEDSVQDIELKEYSYEATGTSDVDGNAPS